MKAMFLLILCPAWNLFLKYLFNISCLFHITFLKNFKLRSVLSSILLYQTAEVHIFMKWKSFWKRWQICVMICVMSNVSITQLSSRDKNRWRSSVSVPAWDLIIHSTRPYTYCIKGIKNGPQHILSCICSNYEELDKCTYRQRRRRHCHFHVNLCKT